MLVFFQQRQDQRICGSEVEFLAGDRVSDLAHEARLEARTIRHSPIRCTDSFQVPAADSDGDCIGSDLVE
jgi:hypothetical protein